MEKIVFTNGCFDIVHAGHIDLLTRARGFGTRLIVGINSDASVRMMKGADRPFVGQDDRKALLIGLRVVDEVIIFDELTPEKLIEEIRPNVLVKGGDWKIDEIIGADFVRATGGEVFSLPLKDGFSSTALIEKIRGLENISAMQSLTAKTSTESSLNEHISVLQTILRTQTGEIEACAKLILETFESGRKVFLCGNGGSAADAQHIAAEFVGRYEAERVALPAIALTTDTSALTAITNDYDFDRVFSRQIEALAQAGDCLIAISTSGNSSNVISALMTARLKGCKVVGMTGATGKKLAGLCDACIAVPSERTARIQEAHITIAHIWCEFVDAHYSESLG